MSRFRGLPPERKMRHDSHFVEEITSQRGDAFGQMIDIERIEPNPHQPRKQFGDLSEMVASIKEKGILEPILVRSHDGNYQIIAGERRYQAAKIAGLQHIPCVEVDVDSRGMLEISLIENLQRKDLSPFEEAAAIQRLCDQFRYTHEEIARKLGKSRTVITETLSLNRMPDEIRERCRQADILSKSMLLQIVRLDTVEQMHKLVDRISGEGITRDQARQLNRDEAEPRPRRYTFRYKPENEAFQMNLTFNKPNVEPTELIAALRQLLNELEAKAAETAHAQPRARRGGNGSGRRKLSEMDWSGA